MSLKSFEGFLRLSAAVLVMGVVGCGGSADKSATAAPEQTPAAKNANDAYVNSAGKEGMQSKTKGAPKTSAKADSKAEAKPAADAPK
ncbi:MAG: hypothetical protein WCJ40_19630 [Planctomycetota bacterium]|jgi:hypothetical protein|nr:hypothetical protein [Planctomycetota bacterium]